MPCFYENPQPFFVDLSFFADHAWQRYLAHSRCPESGVIRYYFV